MHAAARIPPRGEKAIWERSEEITCYERTNEGRSSNRAVATNHVATINQPSVLKSYFRSLYPTRVELAVNESDG